MRETLGFVPKYTTVETFADFARSRGPGLLPPQAVAGAVDRVAALAVPGGGGPEGSAAPTSHSPTQSAN